MTDTPPAFDEAMLRQALVSAVPFNELLGIEVLEVKPGRGVVRLPAERRLQNHVGSQHAGALYLAGEAAGGAAFVGAFAAEMDEITFLMRRAEISYERIARGEVIATCEIADQLARIRKVLETEERTELVAPAVLTDTDGNVVSTLNLEYSVRRRSR